MNKQQFLKTLRSKLQVLEEKEVEDIIKEYEAHIDAKVKDGKTEEEAILDFGPMDELVKEILSAYKISGDYVEKRFSIEIWINKIADKLIELFRDFSKILSSQKGETIARMILKILLIFLFLWLLRLPFYVVEHIGENILHLFPTALNDYLGNVWIFIARLAYVIVSLLLLYVLVKRVIEEENILKEESNEEKPNEKRKKPGLEEKKKEEVMKENEQETNKIATVFQPFFYLIKALVVLVSLPFWAIIIALAIVLGILISLLCEGIYMISIFCIIIGILLITSALLGMIYRITFHKGGKSK